MEVAIFPCKLPVCQLNFPSINITKYTDVKMNRLKENVKGLIKY